MVQLVDLYKSIKPINYPIPTNNLITIFGDSRTAASTEDADSAFTPRLTSQGYGSWVQVGSQFRGKLVANYGINTDTIDGITTRLHAAGIATGSTTADPRRGYALDYDPGLTASIWVILIGVNNSIEVIATTGPKYDTLFKALIDAGKVIVICNEIPNSDKSGQGAVNFGRRQYLDTWPDSSTGMTAAEKTTYGAKVVRVNSYDVMALTPTSYFPKTGYHPTGNLLHPSSVGNRYLGTAAIGPVLNNLLAKAGYAPRNALPTAASQCLLSKSMLLGSTAITATNGETAGVGGANLDGNSGVGVSGNVPSGWTIARGSSLQTLLNAAQPVSGSQLTIVSSKTTDSDGYDAWQIVVTGQVGTISTIYAITCTGESFFTATNIGNTNAGNGVADGDNLYTIGRLKLNDGHQGIIGLGVQVRGSSTTYPDTGKTILSGGVATAEALWDAMATGLDTAILSQPRLIPAGYVATVESKTLGCDLKINICGGVPINFTVTLSRFGMVKNR